MICWCCFEKASLARAQDARCRDFQAGPPPPPPLTRSVTVTKVRGAVANPACVIAMSRYKLKSSSTMPSYVSDPPSLSLSPSSSLLVILFPPSRSSCRFREYAHFRFSDDDDNNNYVHSLHPHEQDLASNIRYTNDSGKSRNKGVKDQIRISTFEHTQNQRK